MNSNLEMQISKTQAGLHTVTYGCKEAPLNVQEAAFTVHGLSMVSPAQLAFLRVNQQGIFNPYSRTNADVLYDERDKERVVIVVPDGIISKEIGLGNLVAAHKVGKEYPIPRHQRDTIYDFVNEMLRRDVAFVVSHGKTEVKTSEFGQNDLTYRLFTDENLGVKAQEYGDWLRSKGRTIITHFFDSEDYAESQEGTYLNRLRVCGPGDNFAVIGNGRDLVVDYGTFGVRFERTAEGGMKKG